MEDFYVCRCEEVTLNDLKDTARKHQCSARELKLRTRAGMGICGGRTCRPSVDKIPKEIAHEDPTDDLPLKVAPPVRPMTLSQLGGESDDESSH